MSVEKTPDGRWRARWRTPDGSAHSKRFTTQREARTYEASQLLQMGRTPNHPEADRKLTTEALSAQWLDASPHLAPGTIATYKRDLTRYILPEFGQIPAANLTAQRIQQWLSEQSTKYAASSVHRHYRTIRTCLAWGVRQGILTGNVADLVQPPRVPKKRPAFLTAEQVERLADEIPHRYRALILVAAYGGLRWSEAIGLRRSDIDGARILVTSQLQKFGEQWVRGEPKTAAGRRMVALPASIGEELAAHIEQFTGNEPEALVFTNQHGNPIGASFRENVWLPALARAELCTSTHRPGRHPAYGPGPTFHDLRHTAVALAIASDAHPKAIQARLGHSSIGVTMDVYGHLFDDGQNLAAGLDELRPKKIVQKPAFPVA